MLARLHIARSRGVSEHLVIRRVPVSPIQRFIAVGGGCYEDTRGFREFTAVKLQAWARCQRQRWAYELQRFPVYHIAALQIQYAWKAHWQHNIFSSSQQQQKHRANPFPPRVSAALQIQAAWKSYTNRRIYRYYRDLISFQHVGDPAQMLRAINPGEASLLDAAMGAHVRFRLGGLSFPPTIYYKIFTRKPVCDLNAFSPKDYALERQTSKEKKSKCDKAKAETLYIRVGGAYFRAATQRMDAQRWYQRMENNGWRPVTAKVVADASSDPIARATAKKPASSRLHVAPSPSRKAGGSLEDREAARRRKKREWMKKLYSQGLLSAKAPEIRPETETEDELPDVDFDSEQWEEEADEMFQWAEALDYDGYVSSWQSLGKTASTDE